MFDFLEALAVGFSVALIFSLIFGFVAFMRYMNYKEKTALEEYGRAQEKESGYE